MKISNLFLLLAAPFSRIFDGRNVDQTSLPASNAATDDWLDLNKISLDEEKEGATSWLGSAHSMLNPDPSLELRQYLANP